jgi:hypothetical protein
MTLTTEQMEVLGMSLFFLAAAELIIRAEELYLEAEKVESWNAPWARNRRRKADKLMAQARDLVGDKGLPWGF